MQFHNLRKYVKDGIPKFAFLKQQIYFKMTENLFALKKKYCKMFSVGFEPVLSAASLKLQPSEPSRLMNSARNELNKGI